MDEFEELGGEFPDIHSLFLYYDNLYFNGVLQGNTTIEWSSSRMTLCGGICKYHPLMGCQIKLSEPLLKLRPVRDLKMVLLHEMIHAHNMTLRIRDPDPGGHGPPFVELMNNINNSSMPDPQRPPGGYRITTTHSMHGEVDNYRVHWWECDRCGRTVKRSMNRPPQEADCIGRVGARGASCQAPRCGYHTHLRECGGAYIKTREPEHKTKPSRKKFPSKKQPPLQHKQPLPPGQQRLDSLVRTSKRQAESSLLELSQLENTTTAAAPVTGTGIEVEFSTGHAAWSLQAQEHPPSQQSQPQTAPTSRLLPKPNIACRAPTEDDSTGGGGAVAAMASSAAAATSDAGCTGGSTHGFVSGSGPGSGAGYGPSGGVAGRLSGTVTDVPLLRGSGANTESRLKELTAAAAATAARRYAVIADGDQAPLSAEELRRRCAEAALARVRSGSSFSSQLAQMERQVQQGRQHQGQQSAALRGLEAWQMPRRLQASSAAATTMASGPAEECQTATAAVGLELGPELREEGGLSPIIITILDSDDDDDGSEGLVGRGGRQRQQQQQQQQRGKEMRLGWGADARPTLGLEVARSAAAAGASPGIVTVDVVNLAGNEDD